MKSILGFASCHFKQMKKLKTGIALFLAFSMLSILSSCSLKNQSNPEDFGSYGADFAYRFVDLSSTKSPGSNNEKVAADFIKQEFKTLGYEAELQSFDYDSGENYEAGSSQNVVVRIPGLGFTYTKEIEDFPFLEGKVGDAFRKTIIIMASYSTPFFAEQNTTFNGISENASGLATLMALAKEMKNHRYGFDVILLATGATDANFAGANAFFSSLSDKEKADLETVYEFRRIYAGSKLYSHSGWNSLDMSKKYLMRRYAYAFSNMASIKDYDIDYDTEIYLNQSIFKVLDPQDPERSVIYREFTLHPSDYRVFDAQGIPCVFVEAFDYNAESLSEQTENKSPDFVETSGQVSGTDFDNASLLKESFQLGALSVRINVVAGTMEGILEDGSLASKINLPEN